MCRYSSYDNFSLFSGMVGQPTIIPPTPTPSSPIPISKLPCVNEDVETEDDETTSLTTNGRNSSGERIWECIFPWMNSCEDFKLWI